MAQQQQRSTSMVFVLVVSAVLLAVATFLTILLITSRASTTAETPVVSGGLPMRSETVMVNDVPVAINVDPNMEVMLATETVQQQVPAPQEAVQAGATDTPTLTPVPSNPTQTPTPIPRPASVVFTNYQVVAGDTLYSIANAHNTSVALMAKHGIDAEDLIPGTTIAVPVPNPAYCNQDQHAYVVKDNDTVYSIANQFATTVEAIAQANGGLGGNFRIEITQVICIP